jgi:hypothetical protein
LINVGTNNIGQTCIVEFMSVVLPQFFVLQFFESSNSNNFWSLSRFFYCDLVGTSLAVVSNDSHSQPQQNRYCDQRD